MNGTKHLLAAQIQLKSIASSNISHIFCAEEWNIVVHLQSVIGVLDLEEGNRCSACFNLHRSIQIGQLIALQNNGIL